MGQILPCGMPTAELELRPWEGLPGQICEQMVAKQMGITPLVDANSQGIAPDNLANAHHIELDVVIKML
jgi:hypothetical protein